MAWLRLPAVRGLAAALAGVGLLLRVSLPVGVGLLVGCAMPEPTAAPPAMLDAAQLYVRNCSACHGERGDGKGLAQTALVTPPRDFTSDEARDSLTREYMVAIVRDGRPHTAMAGRTERLTQAEIEALVDFVRAAFIPAPPGSARARGRTVYRQSCMLCHGERGQGVTRADGRPIPALARSRASPGLGADRMAEAVARAVHVPGAALPPLAIDRADVAAVVDYVRTTFIEYSAAGRQAPPAGASAR